MIKATFSLFLISIFFISSCVVTSPNISPTATSTQVPPFFAPTITLAIPSRGITIDDIQSKWDLWSSGVTLLRGVNIWQALVIPEIDGFEFKGSGRVGPPFTQKDFDHIAQLGINYVVLSVPGLFNENPPYSLDLEVQQNLDNLLEMATRADLFVTIAFRTGPGRAEWSLCCKDGPWYQGLFNDHVWEEVETQHAWTEMWQYTAQRYRDQPAVVGYELMVEPDADDILLEIYDPEEFYAEYRGSLYDWNTFYPQIVTTIRAVDPDTPIIVGGMGYSSILWLPYLQPMQNKNIIYDVHQYMPFSEYTHQQPSGKNSYPGKLDFNGDQRTEDFNMGWLIKLFEPVNSFLHKNKVPIVVNEYGIKRWVPGAAQFISDQMSIFEQNGWNYALWEWSTSHTAYSESVNGFNFLLGSDPSNVKQEIQNDLLSLLLRYWQNNWIHPSLINWAK